MSQRRIDIGDARAPLPSRLGKYTLDREIASGGMGVVYLSRALGPHGYEKRVAIKLVHRHLASDPELVAMLLEEARVASRIVHPNVCSVVDVGADGGTHYLVMEYLEGRTLAQLVDRLASRRTPEPDLPYIAARIGAEVAQGLAAAHSLRSPDGTAATVVHRDVSPQNIHIGSDGAVRVMDFGVAHALDRVRLTEPGTVKGKLAYVAPETLRDSRIDPRADIWALGVCLWELLTCERLFHRESPGATVVAVLERPIPPVRSRLCEVPEELAQIIGRALSRSPDARYSTAADLARDLTLFAARAGRAITMADVARWARHVDTELSGGPTLVHARPAELIAQRADGDTPTTVAHEQPSRPRERRGGRTFAIGAGLVVLATMLGTEATHGAEARTAVVSAQQRHEAGPELVHTEPIAPPHTPDPQDEEVEREALAPSTDASEAAEAPEHSGAVARALPAEPRASPTLRTAVVPAREHTPVSGASIEATDSDRPGTLDVATPGAWSDIWVDGASRGRAPRRLTLSPGEHVIELQRFGMGSRSTHRVMVAPGSHERLVVRETP